MKGNIIVGKILKLVLKKAVNKLNFGEVTEKNLNFCGDTFKDFLFAYLF